MSWRSATSAANIDFAAQAQRAASIIRSDSNNPNDSTEFSTQRGPYGDLSECHTTGGNWRHCKACNTYWCSNCKRKEGFSIANKCPNCGTMGKVENKEPR